MIRILLHGCSGRMGKVITATCANFPNLEIVGGIDKYTAPELKYPIFSSLDECNIEYDVLLDFSSAAALNNLLNFSIKNNKPIVICSTGFDEEALKLISTTSKTIPIFRSANMSIGINLINNILRKVTPFLYDNYDIEIVEKHHNQKLDSPSGTAVLLADTIKDSIKEETHFVNGRDGLAKRQHSEIGIHAVRGGGIVGDHEVIFAGTGEVIELTHKAISREVFAVGALKACEYMAGITSPSLYNMDDVLNLKF
ncbi:4-hydroxy-tetrahydrodipicolinate reductase [Clostridium sp. YIM B02551]|uniref:4-hydroxy-tetrahydrodipicolinate reductase n=1 Tax=Clostridium sp. YIM B02551 TaxID=2910679 RepID=UPI001EEA7365|nr:4-hydroxy-tetrahydrodipicolinate reductase [Clostridium sp. YIM B02551]